MRNLIKVVGVLWILAVAVHAGGPNPQSASENDQTSIVITFKDGHQQSFLMSDIARVEYIGAGEATLGVDHFLGRWQAGAGDGPGSTFFITFETNGEASKSIGASHGTWTIVGNEARISWDDGWHDIIRKIGDQYEKFAFAPGTTIEDKPENITNARKLESKP